MNNRKIKGKKSKLHWLMLVMGLILSVGMVINATSNITNNEINIYCNEQKLSLKVSPEKKGEMYLVPIKAILKQAQLTVTETNGRINATNGKKNIAINITTGNAEINSRIVKLSKECKKVDEELLVPVSFVEEACLFKVEIDTQKNAVNLLPREMYIYDDNGKIKYYGDLSNDGKRNGYGESYDPVSQQLIYAGDWQNNVRQGIGTFTWKNKNTYTGQVKNGEANGKGTLKFANIGTYTGNFVNGKRSGTGTFIWDDGDQYTGSWANDKMNGKGSYTFADGRVYTGTWVNNKYTK